MYPDGNEEGWMRLKRWCVSMTFEPMRFFWTQRGADRFYWARRGGTGGGYHMDEIDKRMGLYRWASGHWLKQAHTLVDMGRSKIWMDAPASEQR